MTREEVDQIFVRVPDLLKFHKALFLDIKRGSNICRVFVRTLKFFECYIEYLKDCDKTVCLMRKYIRDQRLVQHVSLIRKRMVMQDDLIDLLIKPLNRIGEYKKFLDNLFSWADRGHAIEYELLEKVSRRIGNLATHVGKYKYGIINKNEMNKVQRFLSNQCDILSPRRGIVRRGLMTRRTSS